MLLSPRLYDFVTLRELFLLAIFFEAKKLPKHESATRYTSTLPRSLYDLPYSSLTLLVSRISKITLSSISIRSFRLFSRENTSINVSG